MGDLRSEILEMSQGAFLKNLSISDAFGRATTIFGQK